MTSSRFRFARAAVAVVGAASLLVLSAGPAHAVPPPAPVTGLAAGLGVKGLVLTWTASGGGTPVVRDVTGLTPYGPTDGRGVPSGATSAYDTGFTNTVTRTYAVWAAESDGTLSTQAAELTVQAPLPPIATATQLNALPTAVLSGGALSVVGKITRAGLPFAGAKVALRSRVGGTTTEATVAYGTAAADGTLRLTYTPLRTRTYRFAYAGDQFSAASTSVTLVVSLQPRVSAAFSPATVQWKKSSTVSGLVSPNLAGQGVAVQRWYDGAWHTVAWRTLTSTSAWSYVTAPRIGKHAYRAVLPGAVAYRVAVSPPAWLTVTPRTLYEGVSGPDVLVLEKRLRALKYYVGKVDGYFDYDLRHAVYAFQKVERLTPTGKWRSAERTRVLAPRGFRLRYGSDSGLVAEISITRQVLVLHRGATVLRIVDVSTGSEQVYYQDGVKQVAHTPRGVFRIFHKIDGIRVSKLGELYRPSYFYKGWAVHGSGSVPTYPASHGCVRITNHVADLLFETLAIGTKVAVYDEKTS